ncbi:hypothetical protein [Marinomonas communis]|uniref:hypothetical protein n=1 Tax=Marinomonas communis TaxID=28254 RepID=UPI001D198745|nr:hypothetical protein [Marinomonas communis]MCC4273710.1 hypothetical protein [Marinomonas communis]
MILENSVPWLALLISAISLLVSTYAIYRDKSRVKVFCRVVYDDSKDQSESLDNPPPFIRIYAVNTGKRAVFLSNLCGYISRKSSTSWFLKDEPVAFDENGVPSVFASGYAHTSGVRLGDGEVYEYRIKHNDFTKLYDIHTDGTQFKKYFIKDVVGNKYFVKGSRQGIEELVKYKERNISS